MGEVVEIAESFMPNIKIEQLKHLLHSAVSAAYAEPKLIKKSNGENRKGNEQTIAFRVGIHLHELLKCTEYSHLNLDCEYNKHGDDPKRSKEKDIIRPDLIIHSRGNDCKNILVVEFAGWWKESEKIKEDHKKLKELTNPNPNGSYRYKLGVLVVIGENGPTYTYYPRPDSTS